MDEARDGEQGVALARRKAYDLVFMDISAPEVDGKEAARRICALEAGGNRTPIVALTAHAMQDDRESILAAGLDHYLTKPLRKAGFLACGIGLPVAEVAGDMNGLRIGTPELVRWGMTTDHAPRLARLIATALRANDPAALAGEVAEWRRSFDTLHYIHQ